jgi:hypothetical protein
MTIAEIGDVDHAARVVNHRRLRAAVRVIRFTPMKFDSVRAALLNTKS